MKATKPLRGRTLLFTNKFPEIPGTHLIDFGTTLDLGPESTLEPPNGFEHGTPGSEIQRLNHKSIDH